METRYPDSGAAYKRARTAVRPAFSQERLAEAVGITRRHVIRIENGEHRPSDELRERIAAALGVSPNSLPARGATFQREAA